MGFSGSSAGKESVCNAGDPSSIPRSGRFPWWREWLPTPVFLPGESQGQRNRDVYSAQGHRVGHNWVTNHSLQHKQIHFYSKPVFLLQEKKRGKYKIIKKPVMLKFNCKHQFEFLNS